MPNKIPNTFALTSVSSPWSVPVWIVLIVLFPPTISYWLATMTSWHFSRRAPAKNVLDSPENDWSYANEYYMVLVRCAPECRPTLSNGPAPWYTVRPTHYAGPPRTAAQWSVDPFIYNLFIKMHWQQIVNFLLNFLFVLFRKVNATLQRHHGFVQFLVDGIAVTVFVQQRRPCHPHRVRSIMWL